METPQHWHLKQLDDWRPLICKRTSYMPLVIIWPQYANLAQQTHTALNRWVDTSLYCQLCIHGLCIAGRARAPHLESKVSSNGPKRIRETNNQHRTAWGPYTPHSRQAVPTWCSDRGRSCNITWSSLPRREVSKSSRAHSTVPPKAPWRSCRQSACHIVVKTVYQM